MSPEAPHPDRFGRSPAALARGAALLALLGSAAVYGLIRVLARPESPLGALLGGSGIPPGLLAALGIGAVLAVALGGFLKALRTAEVFRLTPRGLLVQGTMGSYLLAWENIRRAEEAAGGALGIQVRDREAVLETHSGSPRQREWLRTMEPFGEWDFLYPRAEIGYPAEQVVEWMRRYLPQDA